MSARSLGFIFSFAALVALALWLSNPITAAGLTPGGKLAPLLGADAPQRIPDQYIVVLNSAAAAGAVSSAADLARTQYDGFHRSRRDGL